MYSLEQEYDKILDDGFSITELYIYSLIKEDGRSFGLSDKEIAKAKKIVDATAEALKNNLGVFTVDGKMVDKPIIERAQRVLELAKAAGVKVGGDN